MLTQFGRRAAIFCIICLVLFGLVPFPLVGVCVCQLFFKHQADGSKRPTRSTR